ncbi:MAG: hypothetical protein AAF485_29710, partial [Chloroflexota bacterium]
VHITQFQYSESGNLIRFQRLTPEFDILIERVYRYSPEGLLVRMKETFPQEKRTHIYRTEVITF